MEKIRETKAVNQNLDTDKSKLFSAHDVRTLISTLQNERFWGEIVIKLKDGKIPTILKQESLLPSIH